MRLPRTRTRRLNLRVEYYAQSNKWMSEDGPARPPLALDKRLMWRVESSMSKTAGILLVQHSKLLDCLTRKRLRQILSR